ncbi:MerR family transcriptional regulator [Mycolicibacterium litorale]|uniref:MerR family transcriptional regulator n=1 Tax=Mycolicibacterium litorale TaxID=758802 RepID=A0AAD1MQE2_9MYCO|nr:MerR family transcriptional regulator [Mycolicibacterium litorale]TDY03220.1 MerR family transcriptional regulator [Mycolicibacterium litorale]BBY15014.1 MerR family transcriptional regulator [Mycolicibacterium litorale]
MIEYRLNELARISGVSTRNIRAYRERGLLDPPRRQGRSAFYNAYHLAQLDTINQLLRRGFSSAHIAEFFASMRAGADLADILGLQRSLFAAEGGRDENPPVARAVDIDADGEEAAQLVAYGLAEVIDGKVVFLDASIAEIVGRASDPMLYIRAIVRIVASTRRDVDTLAGVVADALQECIEARFGPDRTPDPLEMHRMVQDYRELANRLVARHLDEALDAQVSSRCGGDAAGALTRPAPPHAVREGS